MKLTHQIFGVAVVVIFLLTGQYMSFYYPDMEQVGDGLRLLLRTRHIFILLAGLVNIGIGAYFSYRKERWRKVLQMAGSILIIIAPLLFIAAFFYEPKLARLHTPLSHWGMYTIFAGTLFHLLSGARSD